MTSAATEANKRQREASVFKKAFMSDENICKKPMWQNTFATTLPLVEHFSNFQN